MNPLEVDLRASGGLLGGTTPFKVNHWLDLARLAHFQAAELARLLRSSDRQMRRYCRQEFGCSAQQWLDHQRLAEAECLLIERKCVKYVAYELGFKQVSHFSRQFKAHYGLPPSEFMRIALSGN